MCEHLKPMHGVRGARLRSFTRPRIRGQRQARNPSKNPCHFLFPAFMPLLNHTCQVSKRWGNVARLQKFKNFNSPGLFATESRLPLDVTQSQINSWILCAFDGGQDRSLIFACPFGNRKRAILFPSLVQKHLLQTRVRHAIISTRKVQVLPEAGRRLEFHFHHIALATELLNIMTLLS